VVEVVLLVEVVEVIVGFFVEVVVLLGALVVVVSLIVVLVFNLVEVVAEFKSVNCVAKTANKSKSLLF
jgi:hypothetical protein